MELLSILFLCLIFLLTTLFLWLKYDDASKSRQFAKQGLKYVPLGGSLLKKQRMELLKSETIAREGAIFGTSIQLRPTIIIADPQIIQSLLSREFTKFTNRRPVPSINPVLDENIFFVSDEKWKRLRSIITPSFSVGKIRQMKPTMDSTIQTLLANIDESLGEASVQNVKPFFEAFTIETLIITAFGVKVDVLRDPQNPIIVNGRAFFGATPSVVEMLTFAFMLLAPKMAKSLGMALFTKPIDFFTEMSVRIMNQKRVEYRKSNSYAKASCFIEFMLEAEEEAIKMEGQDGTDPTLKKPTKYMTNTEVVSQCVGFFIAGFDSTATTLTLSVYYLALNAEKQAKLHAEIDSVLGKLQEESPEETDPFTLISYENLGKFVYLGAAIDEALRLGSPTTFVERKASEDTVLNNEDGTVKVNVKKDDIIHIPTYTLHRDPKLWSDPETFLPERFLGEPAHHKYAYLPFGGGPRNCVAQRMALFEAKLALLHLLRLYRFERCPQTPVPLQFYNQFNINLNTPKEAQLRIVKRK